MAIDWQPSALDSVVTFARECHSAQLVVMDPAGKAIDETWLADPVDVYAVQKGIVALLFGIAEDQGLLDLSDCMNHHLDPEWTQMPPQLEASLTIETLLTMTTGMSDELAMLGTIGQTWRYNNTAYNYLKKILCRHTGLTLNELSVKWLFEPLGMSSTRWVDRPQTLPDGNPFTGLESTATDLVQVGLLVLNRGEWQGDQLVPQHYIEQLAKPGSEENPAWGLCWWNNHSAHYRIPMREEKQRDGSIIPAAPPGLIAARGAFENALYLVPPLGLVVARTAMPPAPGTAPHFEQVFWEKLMAAMQQS